jgi:hypothetical protein
MSNKSGPVISTLDPITRDEFSCDDVKRLQVIEVAKKLVSKL